LAKHFGSKRGQTLEQILGAHMVASFVPQG
jgi:hypothetical protein